MRGQQGGAAADLDVAVEQAHLNRLGLAAVAQHVGHKAERAQSGGPGQIKSETADRETGLGRQPLDLTHHQRRGGAALQHVRRPRPAGMLGGAKGLSLGMKMAGIAGLPGRSGPCYEAGQVSTITPEVMSSAMLLAHLS